MLRALVTVSLLRVSIAFAEGGSHHVVFDASGTEHTWALKELNLELPSDWSGYQSLVFELRASTASVLSCRFTRGAECEQCGCIRSRACRFALCSLLLPGAT